MIRYTLILKIDKYEYSQLVFDTREEAMDAVLRYLQDADFNKVKCQIRPLFNESEGQDVQKAK